MANEKHLTETDLSRERVWRGPVFEVEVRRVRLPDGNGARRDVVCHKGAVAVLPIDGDGAVYLVRQWRAGYGGLTLELPAGKLDSDGEEPLSAAKRELLEETGFTASRWTSLGEFYGSPAILDEKIHLFLAEGLTAGKPHCDADEFVEVVKMPLGELVARVMAGDLPDGKTQCAALRAEKIRSNKQTEASDAI